MNAEEEMPEEGYIAAHAFRRQFCAIRLSHAQMESTEVTAFSGWCGRNYATFYTALFYSNRERVVHLGLKLYVALTGSLTQRIDVLWDMAVDMVGAYLEPGYLTEVYTDLREIFRGADVKTIRFTDMIAHYRMPSLSFSGRGGDGTDGANAVTASVTRANQAPFGICLSGSGERLELAVSFVPKDVNATNIHHYAALCKYGWTKVSQGVPSGACPIAFWRNMTMRSSARAVARVPMLSVGFRGAPERKISYMVCSFCVQCMNYNATAQTMEFLVLGAFSRADPSTPYGDLTFTTRFCWSLKEGVVYFPEGSLQRAVRIMFMSDDCYRRDAACEGGAAGGEPFASDCWLFRRWEFGGFLQEIFGWSVPRVLWDSAAATQLAREIVGDLAWLSAFREATRGRLPESVYHRIGLAEVPKSVRRAYELGEVLPEVKRRRCGAGGGATGAAALLE